MKDFTGKTALITGGNGGIGLGIAQGWVLQALMSLFGVGMLRKRVSTIRPSFSGSNSEFICCRCQR